MQEFDRVFLRAQWDEANQVLLRSAHLGAAFDHQFRRMLHAFYTADQQALDAVLQQLHAIHGKQFVSHLYAGYCAEHAIPNRASRP